ncbi:hypothetical protein [Methylobacterium hispanicum]|uniref:hypothetical protein n=1 Tax=Methylobacterium hispanicum TaxID=270350 RepID=UPI002F33FCE8
MIIKSAIYSPPSEEMPFLAVAVDDKGEVIVAKSVKSVADGERILRETAREFAEMYKDKGAKAWETPV